MRIQRKHPDAAPPSYGTPGSAGLDLRTVAEVKIFPGEQRLIRLGWAFEIPEGHVGLLFVRSSLGALGFTLANSVGVIDSDYRGEVSALIRSFRADPYTFTKHQKIVQLLIVPFSLVTIDEVNDLSETERGEGGWGSTTK
jgi:dUTP pyrophosphatase